MTSFGPHIPRFPPKFGEDQGRFFKHYDKFQDELDEETVKRLKDNLDGLLVFAGLFAGINTAFIALTLVVMAPDPLEDISSLLQQLIEGLKSPMSLPSASFAPAAKAVVINSIFALSLVLALCASFFAVLGKQWLTLYRNKDGGGVDRQRWEQLRRALGAERWGLVPALEVWLPSFIQAALIIFATGFVLFLRTMNETLWKCVLVPLLVAGFLGVLTVVSSLLDVSCPFKNPFSEGVIWILSRLSWIQSGISWIGSGISWIIRWYRRAREKKRIQAIQAKWEMIQISNGSEEVRTDEEPIGKVTGYEGAKDEETGHAGTQESTQSVSSTPSDQTTNTSRSTKVLTRNWVIWGRMRGMINSFQGLWWGTEIDDDRVLEVESIKRVFNVSEDPDALYHAALNLRSIKDLELLRRVHENETTTWGLRECYLEALEELERKDRSDKQYVQQLRKTLAFGMAFFHVAFSAASFDDFITIIGMKEGTLPSRSFAMSPWEAQEAGENCRRAQSFVRQFMNLQLRRLGRQPVAITSTTLAANAFWYAINGIPHSQDLVYGARFREALISSDVSWAGLGLLASVSNNIGELEDASQIKPYRIKELNWYREAFLRVREIYFLHEPTQELADAICQSLGTGQNLGSNSILFKLSWKLFPNYDEDNPTQLGERALSKGHVLLCALEKAIRHQKKTRSQEMKNYQEAITRLKPASAGEQTKDLEALSAEVAISEEEATRALENLRAEKALSNDSDAANTSEPFRVAFRAAIQALVAIGGRMAFDEAEAKVKEKTIHALAAIGSRTAFNEAEAKVREKAISQETSQVVTKVLKFIRSQTAMGALSAIRSQSETPNLREICALAVIRTWLMVRAGRAIRTLTVPRKYQENTSHQEIPNHQAAISQAATSARKALRALKATEEHKNARGMCFTAMIESMGSRDAGFSVLKRTAWRQRLALKTATEYMNYIMTKEERGDSENAFAKDVVTRIRDAQIEDERVVSALGTEHAKIKQEFEDTFSEFSKWLSGTSGADGGLQQPERGSADSGISPADGQSASISTPKEQ
ncbi:hypothetical protein FRC01_004386 [Tulasnella sp. 417]|nr:hypothetical protein FRC01_004386 [Tulasnella sp. 417]